MFNKSPSFRVQVLIPTYNRKHTIIKVVNSIFSAGRSEVLVTIVDNNSSDKTIESLHAEFPTEVKAGRLKVVENDTTVPIIDNWNRCLEQVSDQVSYVKLLWSDDSLKADYFDVKLSLFSNHPDVLVVGNNLSRVSSDGERLNSRSYGGLLSKILSVAFRNRMGYPSTWLFRVDLFQNSKTRFNNLFPYSADVAFLFDLLGGDFSKIKIVSEELTEATVASNTETSKYFGTKEMLYERFLYRKYLHRKKFTKIPKLFLASISVGEKIYFYVRRFLKA